MEARSWADYKVAKRIEISLNPIRNWVETVMPSIEQEYKKLKEEQNLTRPEKPIVFLLGDPTKFKRFKTPIEYR